MVRTLLLLAASFLLFPKSGFSQKDFLKKLLYDHRDQFGPVLDSLDHFQPQVLYIRIDRDSKNRPSFTPFEFNVDATRYHYPASTVKMPTALVAMEKLNQLKIIGLDKNTPMKTGAGHAPQVVVSTDTSSQNGLPSIGHYVKKVFLVSDNEAHNRLYEFCGQQYLNETLWRKGYRNLRITHRLSAPGYDPESNRYTNPVSFYGNNQFLYYQGEVQSRADASHLKKLKGQFQGKGYLDSNGGYINSPFDFSQRNFMSLADGMDILKAVIFPEAVEAHRRFDLSEYDYRFLYQCMSEFPKESQYPRYAAEPDGYCKFLLLGGKQAEAPPNLRIFNKVGDAYGFLIDLAYVVDFEKNVEFLLGAVISCNTDGIFNDDAYRYDDVGYPFMAALGKVIYESECQRARKHRPDLSRFKVASYD